MTTNYGKTFFSESRAKKFAEQLRNEGCEDIKIWAENDAFDQKNYTVRWNKW